MKKYYSISKLLNERGVTLIELLVSIVILSMILFSLANSYTSFILDSKESDRRIILLQEAMKQLEEQRQQFYDRLDFVSFPNLNDKVILHTYNVNLDHEYLGEVWVELVEQEGRYQLIKMTSSIGDINDVKPRTEVTQYVTNR